jgi:hypothetical protein
MVRIKDTLIRNMGGCSCSDLTQHQGLAIFYGLLSGIAGIVALAVNDVSECAESYQKLRLVGIVLSAVSVCFFINTRILKRLYGVLVVLSSIFVFVLDCMLIDDIVRGNKTDGCRGGSQALRVFIVVWIYPFTIMFCLYCKEPDRKESLSEFYGDEGAEFQTLLL